MSRKKVSIILSSKPNYNEYALKYFVLSLNKIQSHYEFVFPEVRDQALRDFYSLESYDEDSLFKSFSEKVKPKFFVESKPDFWINIVTSTIGPIFFLLRWEKLPS